MATAAELIEGPSAESGIRGRLQDVTDASYGDNLLINFMNDGCTEFAETTGCCQTSDTITTDGSASTWAVTTSNLTYRYVNVYAVEYNGAALDFAPLYEMRAWATAASGTPTGWSVWADTLYLDTIPIASQTLTVWYTYIPTDMTATTSTVGIPEKWHPAIKAYAEYRVRKQDRDSGLAADAYAEYDALRKSAAMINEALFAGGYR